MNDPADTLRDVLGAEIQKQLGKGRVLSTVDAGNFLDHWLEQEERTRDKELYTEEQFESLCDKVIGEYVLAGDIYTAGDPASYTAIVRTRGYAGYWEAYMIKRTVEYKRGDTKHRCVFRDTEFPYDPETGNYII